MLQSHEGGTKCPKGPFSTKGPRLTLTDLCWIMYRELFRVELFSTPTDDGSNHILQVHIVNWSYHL